MKLSKINDCQETLTELFNRSTTDFTTAEALCDLLMEFEKQKTKYEVLRRKIICDNYTTKDDGTHVIKSAEMLEIAQKQFDELNDLSFSVAKRTIAKPESISPKELFYLKEFFDFA